MSSLPPVEPDHRDPISGESHHTLLHPHVHREILRPLVAVLTMLGLIGVSIWVMSPFIPSLIWAITIVIATWPLMRKLEARLGGSRGWAVTGMTLALLLLFFGPLTLAIATIVENADRIAGWIKTAAELPKTVPPKWLIEAPLVGERAAAYWRELGDTGFGQLVAKVMPYAGVIAAQVLKQAGLIATITMQFLLTVTLCALLYMGGEDIGMRTLAFFRRLAGVRGERTARLAAASVRGVALGVVVTALVQALLGGIGLALAGVPAWSLLTAVMLLLAIAQIGVVPVMVPAAIWLFWADHTMLGIAMVVWTLFVGTLDNFLRPWLIRQGAKLPLSLIFAGVVGGMMAFGMIGMFIGPVVLAVTYTLLDAWIDDVEIDTGEEEAVS